MQPIVMPFDLDAEAAEIRAMPRCLACGGCGWYNEMGPNTFPVACACREALPVLCPCCNVGVRNMMDQYGRCHKCMDMVPTRRGGWRQLGVYDG